MSARSRAPFWAEQPERLGRTFERHPVVGGVGVGEVEVAPLDRRPWYAPR